MEIWFWYALGGAVFAGIPSFILKVATKRNYSSELFVIYGALISAGFLIPLVYFFVGIETLSWPLAALAIFSGAVASIGGIFRLYALHAIDTTIYFPLVKVFSPALAILAGVIFFSESFSYTEWIGLLLGIFVPLLLVSRMEHSRQNNLVLGLFLVLLTGLISAVFSALSKYAVDAYDSIWWFLAIASIGVFVGSTMVTFYKYGVRAGFQHVQEGTSQSLLLWSTARAILVTISFGSILLAYSYGGPLAIVHTIHSLYILVPIVLSIIFYNEHWNTRKVISIVLSVAALALLQ